MNDIDMTKIDLNLLVFLDVLLEERHVSRAAKRLQRTQSATSHALGRLRKQLDDPILIRVGGEMRPTPRALRMAPEVRRLVQSIRRVLSHETHWEPASSERTFTLVAPDLVYAMLPGLYAYLEEHAPHSSVELVSPEAMTFQDVVEGRYDLAIAPNTKGLHEDILCEPLVSLEWLVYMKKPHPARTSWGVDAWLSYKHVRIGKGAVFMAYEEELRKMGLPRKMGPVLPHFLLGPSLLTQTDLLLTLPRGSISENVSALGLRALPCPVDIPPVELALYRSSLYQREPAMRWFRHAVHTVMSETFEGDVV